MGNNYVCVLSVRRSLAPATLWHWAVDLPDGNMWAASDKSFDSAGECMEDAQGRGLRELARAEREWSCTHMDYARATGMDLVEEADEDEDEIGWDDPLGGCLVLFACGVLFVMGLLGWWIWLACGRWPALCRMLPMAGAVLLGMGIAALIGYARRRGRV